MSPQAAQLIVARPAPVAEWPLLRELDSDLAQRVFHATMEAFARPGTIHRLPEASIPAGVPAVVVPLLALADIMTPVAALESAASELDTAAAIALAARLVNTRVVDPAQARFALAFAEPDELAPLNRGSHWSPELGAMLFQRTPSVEAVTDSSTRGTWRLTGPGIKPSEPTLLRVAGLGRRFVAERAERVADYPAGIDVLLATDAGDIIGLPRTTAIEVL